MDVQAATHGAGNPNAAQLTNSPEAASSGSTIAPAPPGGISYLQARCGWIRTDGKPCMNFPWKNHDQCFAHYQWRLRKERDAAQ